MKTNKCGGFTLIEIMVTLAILGIAITVLLDLLSGGLRLGRKSEDYSRAVFYGRQLLEELSLKTEFTTLQEQGTFEGDYEWTYEVEPLPLVSEKDEEAVPVTLYRISVSVLWPSGDKTKTVSFETMKTIAKSEDNS